MNRSILTFSLASAALLAALLAPRLVPAAPSSTERPLAVPLDAMPVVAPPVAELPVSATPMAVAPPTEPPLPDPIAHAPREVDLVIALDTSGSMDGLLDSARARLWDIVQAVGRNEPDAKLRVALLTFGSPVEGADAGYVVVRSPLTTDLDAVYAQLMALRTDGGDEFVGWTLDVADRQLAWSKQPNAAHLVFVAGNESADQGREKQDFRRVVARMRERGTVVNAIYAGAAPMGVSEQWEEVARAGRGVYSAIDQAEATAQVASPHDDALRALNEALNATYVGYGDAGAARKDQLVEQDRATSGMGSESLSTRIAVKASAQYDNAVWDLVDGVRAGKVDLAKSESLPEELRNLDLEGRKQAVADLEKRRARIRDDIQRLEKERADYLEANAPASQTYGFDDALEAAIDAQL